MDDLHLGEMDIVLSDREKVGHLRIPLIDKGWIDCLDQRAKETKKDKDYMNRDYTFALDSYVNLSVNFVE